MKAYELIELYAGKNICKIVISEDDERVFSFEPDIDDTPEDTYWRFNTIAMNERCLSYMVKYFEVVNRETENYNSILYIEVE